MSIYLKSLLDSLPRILNQLDRNPSSPTYGCFDRDHWHYKTSDFACARKQEAALSLALLSAIRESPFYRNTAMEELARAAIAFWPSIQDADGSFSEWYPNEHSFVATAFSAYAVSESLLALGMKPDRRVGAALRKAGDFLAGNEEFRVQNQQAGAIAALQNISFLAGDQRYSRMAAERASQLALHQSSEGWFHEYGGPDIGYLSLAADYLCKYHDRSRSAVARRMAEKAVGFITNFLHPDFTCGGAYASRNTEYLIPSCCEHPLSSQALARFCREGIAKGSLPSCGTLDDRYLLYNGYTYAQAHLLFTQGKSRMAAPRTSRTFQEAGIMIRRTKAYFFVANLRKGGAFYFYSFRRKRSLADSGIFVRRGKGTLTSSCVGSSSPDSTADGASVISVSGTLQRLPVGTISPAQNAMLRLFQISGGKSAALSRLLKEIFRNKTITPDSSSRIPFKRAFILKAGSVDVEDCLPGKEKYPVVLGAKQPIQYVPSSRFFSGPDLDQRPVLASLGNVPLKRRMA